jgi:hypothetical protein
MSVCPPSQVVFAAAVGAGFFANECDVIGVVHVLGLEEKAEAVNSADRGNKGTEDTQENFGCIRLVERPDDVIAPTSEHRQEEHGVEQYRHLWSFRS